MNVLSVKLRETREDPDQAGDGTEHFVGDGVAFGRRFLRVRHFQVAHRDAAQARDGTIKERNVEAGQTEGRMRQRPQQEFSGQVLKAQSWFCTIVLGRQGSSQIRRIPSAPSATVRPEGEMATGAGWMIPFVSADCPLTSQSETSAPARKSHTTRSPSARISPRRLLGNGVTCVSTRREAWALAAAGAPPWKRLKSAIFSPLATSQHSALPA